MPGEQVFKADPLSLAGGKIISSPFQFAFTGEDHLRVRSFNSLAGVVLSVDLRTLSTTGAIQVTSHEHTPNSDRTAKTTTIPMAKGYVLNLVVRAKTGTPMIGQTYVIVELVRGLGSNAQILGQLLGDYVTSQQGVAFPGSPIRSSIEGGGYFRTFQGTVPGLGAEVMETVPTGARWEPYIVRVDLVTSGAAGNRLTNLLFRTPAVDFIALHLPLVAAVALSTTALVWQRGPVSGILGSASQYVGSIVEGFVLTAGCTIRTATAGLLGGDQYSVVGLSVREWLEAA